MHLRISHKTLYRFDEPVTYGLQQLRLTPKTSHLQRVETWDIAVTGGRQELSFEDHHHNVVNLISFDKGASALEVTCQGTVSVAETHGVVGRHRGPLPLWYFNRSTPRTQPGKGCRTLLRNVEGATPLDQMHALSAVIRESINYEVGSSDTGWSAEEVVTAGHGVCQDHAHVFVTCARLLGHPARYVSGYLMIDGTIDQDATHAWAEAHVDGLGWVGFDISNGISPDIRYVRVATGLDYAEAAPVTGTRIGGSGESLSVQIEVAQQ